MIEKLEIVNANDLQVEVHFETRQIENRVAKPKEILTLLGFDPLSVRVLKRETRFLDEVPAGV